MHLPDKSTLDIKFCHKMLKPTLRADGFFHEENKEALDLWGLVNEDRNLTQGPTSIPTPTITDICRAFGASRGVFLKIKFIEHIYYTSLLKQQSQKLEEIKNKKPQPKG